jgi:signal peptidase II
VTAAKRFALISTVSFACAGCDHATKLLAQSYLPRAATRSFLGDTLRLQLAHNPGGFLSFGDALPEPWRHLLFSDGVGVMLAILVGYALLSKRLPTLVTFAIALYVAGGASNLADRLLHGGVVLDFINVGIGPLRTGIFNVADMCIMASATLLLFYELRRRYRSAAAAYTEEAATFSQETSND